jgi:alpha-tubulin suppressor-like RCC1 family protein
LINTIKCIALQAIKALGELKEDVSVIAAGRESSYFLLESGLVKACGRNDEGQLGDGTFVNNEFTDVLIPKEDIVSNLGSGPSSQSVFFFGENAVYGSGANDRFQLGLGEIGSQTLPVQVDFKDLATTEGIIKISSSGTHTVALNVPVDMPLSDTGIPTFSPTAGNRTGIPTFSPTVGNGTDTGIPTFSPTVQPTTLGVESDIPTFSPTATPVSHFLSAIASNVELTHSDSTCSSSNFPPLPDCWSRYHYINANHKSDLYGDNPGAHSVPNL